MFYSYHFCCTVVPIMFCYDYVVVKGIVVDGYIFTINMPVGNNEVIFHFFNTVPVRILREISQSAFLYSGPGTTPSFQDYIKRDVGNHDIFYDKCAD